VYEAFSYKCISILIYSHLKDSTKMLHTPVLSTGFGMETGMNEELKRNHQL
jgi:hypothetical protein